MLPRHEIVYANGFATESFYPGASAVAWLSPSAQLSLLAQFPGFDLQSLAPAYGNPIMPFCKSRDLPNRRSDLQVEPVPSADPLYAARQRPTAPAHTPPLGPHAQPAGFEHAPRRIPAP